MAQPQIRKVCRVTAQGETSVTVEPTTNDKSPAMPITNTIFNLPSAPTDFWAGPGRFEIIIRRVP